MQSVSFREGNRHPTNRPSYQKLCWGCRAFGQRARAGQRDIFFPIRWTKISMGGWAVGLVKSRSFRCFLGELQMVTTTITRGTFHAHIFSSSFRCVFRPFFREILSLDHGIDLLQTKNVRHHQCDAALSLRTYQGSLTKIRQHKHWQGFLRGFWCTRKCTCCRSRRIGESDKIATFLDFRSSGAVNKWLKVVSSVHGR